MFLCGRSVLKWSQVTEKTELLGIYLGSILFKEELYDSEGLKVNISINGRAEGDKAETKLCEQVSWEELCVFRVRRAYTRARAGKTAVIFEES